MKRSMAPIIALGLLVMSTGCKTVDEDQALRIQESVKPAIATAVLFGIKAEPKVGPAMLLAQANLELLMGVGTIEPSQIMSALVLLGAEMDDDTRAIFMASMNTALGLYAALAADTVQSGISQTRWLALSLNTLYKGISEGISQARMANLL